MYVTNYEFCYCALFCLKFNNAEQQPLVLQVIIHTADAPCHGTQYHTDGGDTYPYGDPAGISHEEMMKQVVENKVYYWFGYISQNSTDQMISVFNQSLRFLSGGKQMISQFDATKPEMVADVPRYVRAEVFASNPVIQKSCAVNFELFIQTFPSISVLTLQTLMKTLTITMLHFESCPLVCSC